MNGKKIIFYVVILILILFGVSQSVLYFQAVEKNKKCQGETGTLSQKVNELSASLGSEKQANDKCEKEKADQADWLLTPQNCTGKQILEGAIGSAVLEKISTSNNIGKSKFDNKNFFFYYPNSWKITILRGDEVKNYGYREKILIKDNQREVAIGVRTSSLPAYINSFSACLDDCIGVYDVRLTSVVGGASCAEEYSVNFLKKFLTENYSEYIVNNGTGGGISYSLNKISNGQVVYLFWGSDSDGLDHEDVEKYAREIIPSFVLK
ncbi:MAG: hypothetical protein PHE24_03705 [Patescibacteria group bacterium]|nr:hypothetical protein [Patescibacteria group bacterium]